MATCVRTAWLTLPGGRSVLLEDPSNGYLCTLLDLGFPIAREVLADRPAADGADDLTAFMGPRSVEVDITAAHGAGAQIDAVASLFAPYMQPAQRPVLHYVLDRPGTAERVLTMRATAYAWPVAGPDTRQLKLQFVAADPIIRDPVVQTSTGWAGSSSASGRAYPLVPPRVYPAGASAPSRATVDSHGEVRVWPLYRIYGPVSNLVVTTYPVPAGANTVFTMLPSFQVNAGHWLDIDNAAKTVTLDSDPQQSQFANVDWQHSAWAWVDPDPSTATVGIVGSGATGVTQVQAIWQDAFLT